MKVLIFGATGMVGQGVLRECVLASDVDEIVVIGRSSLSRTHNKISEIVLPDLTDLANLTEELATVDACFFCLGVSSTGKAETEYRKITYDLTLAIAGQLAQVHPDMVFIYVSGEGTNENGRAMRARVKGATENALLRLPLRAYMLRPGFIQPRHGIRSRTKWYNVIYRIAGPLIPVVRLALPKYFTATDTVGAAMLAVARNPGPNHILDTRSINQLVA